VSRVLENLGGVRRRIAAAARRAGRDPGSVELCAVTKTAELDAVREVVAAGVRHLGENRLQAAEPKIRDAADLSGVCWRMIGHLQRNKARRAVELFDWIDAVDGLKLARRLSALGEERERPVRVLVEVNTSNEVNKGGFPVAEAGDALGQIRELPGMELRGLMTMAPFTDDEGAQRACFGTLRRIRDESPFAGELPVLSMGMTNDYEIAVEEGATLVRVGTAIFG
jgi:pyridoxal phosphate enzyme (YggS family)